MTCDEKETLKALISDSELQAMVYGRCKERQDTNESYKMAPALESIAQKQFVRWSNACNKLHNYLDGLVK